MCDNDDDDDDDDDYVMVYSESTSPIFFFFSAMDIGALTCTVFLAGSAFTLDARESRVACSCHKQRKMNEFE